LCRGSPRCAPSPPYLFPLSLHDALPICPFLPSNNKVSAFLISSLLTTFSLTEYRRSLVTVTVTSCMMMSEVSLDGKLTGKPDGRSEEHTSELQSREKLVCRLLLEKKKEK